MLVLAAALAAVATIGCGTETRSGADGVGSGGAGGEGGAGGSGEGGEGGEGGGGSGGMGGGAGGSGPSLYGLVIRGEDLGAWVGRTVNAEITDAEGTRLTSGFPFTIAEDGTFRMDLPGAYPEGTHLQVRFWADVDGDAACDDAPDRHALVEFPALASDVEAVFRPDSTEDPSLCSGFDWVARNLTIRVTGLEGVPDGAAAVVDLYGIHDGTEFPAGELETVAADGGFTADLPGTLYAETDYVVRWFVDANGSATCDATESGGTATLRGGPASIELDLAPDAGSPPCSTFTGWGYGMTIRGTGFGDVDDHSAEAILVALDSGTVVAGGYASVAEGAFTIFFTDSVPGGFDYELLFYVDADDSYACNSPPDVVGSLALGVVSGETTIDLEPPVASDGEACVQINAHFGG